MTTIEDSPKGSAIEQVTRLVEQGFEILQDFYLNGIGHKSVLHELSEFIRFSMKLAL